MTRGDLIERVVHVIGEDDGNRYLSGNWRKINPLVDTRLLHFTEASLCLWDPVVALTVTQAGGALLDIRDVSTPVVSKPVVRPVAVFINGVQLTDYMGETDALGYPEFACGYPRYPTDAEGTPRRWLWEQADTIRLHPAPSEDYSDCFIAGWTGHPALTGSTLTWAAQATIDNTENVLVPVELEDALVHFVAEGLVVPSKRPELVAVCRTVYEDVVQGYRTQQRNRFAGAMARGPGRSVARLW